MRLSSAAPWQHCDLVESAPLASIKVIPDTFAQDADRMARFADGPETNYLTDHYRNYPVVLMRLCKIRIDQPRDLQGSRRLPWIAASVLASVALGLGIAAHRATKLAEDSKTQARLTIPLPPGQEIIAYPAITRDGRTIAYATQQGTSETQFYLRDLNAFDARPVPGSNGARQPFFAPDGKWVAFFARVFIQKAEVAGGAPIRVVEAPYSQGGTWNEDNTIIYAASLGSGLLLVPAGGGTPESLTKPGGAANGYTHVLPQALPSGRHVLFAVWGQRQGTVVLSLASRKWELVLPSTSFAWGVFDPAGGSGGRLLLINESGGMRAAPFDCSSCTHRRRHHGTLQRLLRHGNRMPGLARGIPHAHCGVCTRQPGCRWFGWTAREGARR